MSDGAGEEAGAVPDFMCPESGVQYDSGNVPELGLIVKSDAGGSFASGTLYIDERSLTP